MIPKPFLREVASTPLEILKRKCKNVSVRDFDLILKSVHECFKPAKKRKRRDTVGWFAKVLKVSRRKSREILLSHDERYELGCERIARQVESWLQDDSLEIQKVTTFQRIDPGSRKVRTIARLNIKQLVLDHVAVTALEELSKRIGYAQVSSIKGRGAHYGKHLIQSWIVNSRCRMYYTKLDIKDFYGSTDRGHLMKWLKARVANKPLLTLIRKLIFSSPSGLPIGSFLSQTLANIYLSDIFHFAKEQCKYRKGVNQVDHVLMYMDDIVLIGSNKRQLKYAVEKIIQFVKDKLHLTIKPNWNVRQLTERHPLDMMGFRFYKDGYTNLRKRIFKYVRRSLVRAKNKHLELHQARRMMSYKGYADYTAIKSVLMRLSAVNSFQRAISLISNHDILQSHIFAGADPC